MLGRLRGWINTHRVYTAVFLVALTVRVFLIAIAPPAEITSYWIGFDGKDYVHEAQNILDGHGFSRDSAPPYSPDALKTPLYPLALAGVHLLTGSFIPILFFQAILGSMIPLFGIAMGRFFIRDKRVLLTLGLFLALEPHFLFSSTFFGTEGIALFLTAWGLYELLRLFYSSPEPLRAGLVGFIWGLTTLARPISLYLPIVLLPLFAYQGYLKKEMRKMLSAFGIFLVVFVLILSPWVVRNYLAFGTVGFSSASWFNVYTRLTATVVAIDTGDDFYTSFQKLLNNLATEGYVGHPPPVTEFEIEDLQFVPILKQESFRLLGEHKIALVEYLALEPFTLLTQTNVLGYASSLVRFDYARPDFSPTLYASQHGVFALIGAIMPYLFGPYIVPYLVRAFLAILCLLACWGALILWRRKEKVAALFLFGFIVYLTVLTASAGAQIGDRHRAPFLPAEALLAAVALERFVERRNSTTIAT